MPPSDAPGRRSTGSAYLSPLRYPGGKRKLARFMEWLAEINDLEGGDYAEVYAGGASIALSMLFDEYARRVHINDLDRGIGAFWDAALNRTDELCAAVREVAVTMDEWRRQRAVYKAIDPDPLALALATFYLNRTNRSGIVTGGVIGGKEQGGRWKLDARFNKDELIGRIEKIGRYASRIRLHRLDAAEFLRSIVPTLPAKTLIYLDPPYYVKGDQALYVNSYAPGDHQGIAEIVKGLDRPWVVTYDDAPAVVSLYASFSRLSYGINYSAQDRYRGGEVAFFAPGLKVPRVSDPTRVS